MPVFSSPSFLLESKLLLPELVKGSFASGAPRRRRWNSRCSGRAFRPPVAVDSMRVFSYSVSPGNRVCWPPDAAVAKGDAILRGAMRITHQYIVAGVYR